MIVVLVKYECKENCAKSFVEKIKAEKIDMLCRGEEGNIRYDYSFAENDPNAVILTEIWENQEVLKTHGTMPHMAKLAEIKAEFVNSTVIDKFEAVKL